MEYHQKKKQILEKVEYSNLLTFSLVENKLERNFKSIVEAVMLSQQDNEKTKHDLASVAQSCSKDIKSLMDRVALLESQQAALINKSDKSDKRVSLHYEAESKEENPHSEDLSSPVVKLSLVDSMPDVEDKNKESENKIPNMSSSEQKERLQELRQEIHKIRANQDEIREMEKMMANMKDSINYLKAEMKALADRSMKSIKRASIGSLSEQNPNIVQNQNHSPQLQPPASSTGVFHENGDSRLQDEFDREINNLHIEINTLKLSYQELRELTADSRRKDSKLNLHLDQIQKSLKKVQDRVDADNENYERQFKEIKMELLNLQTIQPADDQSNSKKSRKNIEATAVNPNANNQINDRVSKLQAAIQGLVTEAEFKRFKNQVKDDLTKLENEDENIKKDIKDEVQMLTELIDMRDEKMTAMQKQIDELKDKYGDMSGQCERKNNIAISRCEELKKGLQNLKEDLEFYKSMSQNQQSQPKPQQLSADQGGERRPRLSDEQPPSKSADDMKKYLNRKLHDQRTYLLGLIRDLEKKSSNKSGFEQDVVNIWDKLTEINLFLNKKANEDDIKKSLAYLEKKMASVYNRITSTDQNTEDARISKTNWFCLSCDKNLHNYQGKIGKHVVWDSMPIKPGYAKYFPKDDPKKSLPQLKR